MYISKQQQKEILGKIPPGQDPAKIFKGLVDRGHTLEGYNSSVQTPLQAADAPTENTAQLRDTGSFFGNVKNSAKNFVGGIVSAVAHPIETVKAVGKAALGAGEHAVEATTPIDFGDTESKQMASSIADFFGQRYGSLEDIKKTAYQDPVGFVGDLSTLLSAGGGVVSKVGQAGNISKVAEAGKLASTAGSLIDPLNVASAPTKFVSKLAGTGLEKLSGALEKSTYRMTPLQKSTFSKRLDDIVDYTKNWVKSGTPEERFAAGKANIAKFEKTLQNYLDDGAGDIVVAKQTVLDDAEKLKTTFQGERDALAIDKQIDAFKNLIETKYPDQIPVSQLNKLKRSTFENAFNTAGEKVLDSVEFSIGDMLYDHIKAATTNFPIMGKYPIEEVNKAYKVAIDANKLLKAAVGRAEVSGIDRLVLAGVGLTSAGPAGAVVSQLITDHMPITKIKTAASKAADKAGKAIPKVRVRRGLLDATNAAGRFNQARQQR